MVAFHFMQSCEMYMCQETKKEKKKKAKNRELQQTLPWYCPRREENLSFIRCLTITKNAFMKLQSLLPTYGCDH